MPTEYAQVDLGVTTAGFNLLRMTRHSWVGLSMDGEGMWVERR